MKKTCVAGASLFSLLLAVSVPAAPGDWEITPFAGYRFGGGFDETGTERRLDLEEGGGLGLVVGRALDHQRKIEVLLSRQSSAFEVQDLGLAPADLDASLNVYYLHLGGAYLFDGQRMRPFLSGGLGVSHFDPADPQLSRETRFSGSLGGGLLIALTQNVGIRLEGRGYLSLFDSSGSIFCSGGCVISLQGDAMTQFEFMAGISAAF